MGKLILNNGQILTDLNGKKWFVGQFVNIGGNGEVHTATGLARTLKKYKNFEYCVKIETYEESFMEEELNFYTQNAKIKDIKNYMKSKSIQKLGIPHYISNGIFEKDGKSYKFIILPRFGKSIGHFINYEYRAFLPQTIYRLTLQILDALEYIHKRNYIHGDLKADNILLGYGSKSKSHINIVDFGTSLPVSSNFLETPDSTSFGTWTYNARDSHRGIPTFRGDLETLLYNIIEWSGIILPWLDEKFRIKMFQLQQTKEIFMTNIENNLNNLFNDNVPKPILLFAKYVGSLKIHEKPDFDFCKSIFLNGLNDLGQKNSGNLNLRLIESPIIGKNEKEIKNEKLETRKVNRTFRNVVNMSLESNRKISEKYAGNVKRSPAFDSDKENINPRSKKRKHETNLLNESKLPTKILKVG